MQAGSVLVSGRISSELSNNWPSILLSQVLKQTLSWLQQSSQSCRLGHLDSNIQKLWNGELFGPKCDTKLHSLLSAQSCLHSATVSMSGRLWIRLLLWTSQAWVTEQVLEGRAGLPRAEPASRRGRAASIPRPPSDTEVGIAGCPQVPLWMTT